MLGYQKMAVDCLTRGVILGRNTKLETLTESESWRHEALLARTAQKASLMNKKFPREQRAAQDEKGA